MSKFFHDPASVRTRIRERIEGALEIYDYRPNIFAINQNRASTKTVGILVRYISDPYFSEIARSIERLCGDACYWPRQAPSGQAVVAVLDRSLRQRSYRGRLPCRGLRNGPPRRAWSRLRVAGHDDHPWPGFASPSPAGVAQDYAGMGKGSAERLLALFEGSVPSAWEMKFFFQERRCYETLRGLSSCATIKSALPPRPVLDSVAYAT